MASAPDAQALAQLAKNMVGWGYSQQPSDPNAGGGGADQGAGAGDCDQVGLDQLHQNLLQVVQAINGLSTGLGNLFK